MLNHLLEIISLAFTSKELSPRQKWILGLTNLALVVVFWVLSSFLVNDLFESDVYRKPFFITYINTGCFAFYLIPYLFHHNILLAEFIRRVRVSYHEYQHAQQALVETASAGENSYIRLTQTQNDASRLESGYGSADNLSALDQQLQLHQKDCSATCLPSMSENLHRAALANGSTVFDHTPENTRCSTPASNIDSNLEASSAAAIDQQLFEATVGEIEVSAAGGASSWETEVEIPIYETINLSLQFSILWFSANLVTNASLSYTSVASQTILSSSSSFFTLIIGYICSVERINTNKIVGLVLSFIGVIIVTKVDSNDPPSSSISPFVTFMGNLLALSGALFYGVYTILLKFKVMIKDSKKERNLNTHLFFAFVGIFSLVLLWPVIFGLHIFGIEKFKLPPTRYALTLLFINALITFVSDFCWCRAVLLTSPLTVTVGLSMTIPLAMIGDWLIKGFNVNTLYLLGAAVVTIGFLIINKDEEGDFLRE